MPGLRMAGAPVGVPPTVGCAICHVAGGGHLNHVCPVCSAEVCPHCAARGPPLCCPSCGDVHSNQEALQHLAEATKLYAEAERWLGKAKQTAGNLGRGALDGLRVDHDSVSKPRAVEGPV